MDLIDHEFIKNRKPFTSFDLLEGNEERQRKFYDQIMRDGAKISEKVIKDYVSSVIDTELKKYLDRIGNDIGIDKNTDHIFELFSVFLHEIGKRFNIPTEEEDPQYEKFGEFVEKHIKELKLKKIYKYLTFLPG